LNKGGFIMKKVLVGASLILSFSVGTGFAAPINDLGKGQTAVGVLTDTIYVEHKLSDNLTIGYQNIDRKYGDSMDDFYGQYKLSNSSGLRAILGHRDLVSGSTYIGLAISDELAPRVKGYASVIGSSDFTEYQVGANYELTHEVDLNVNYRNFRPDHDRNDSRVEVGATYKF
jgi:predicted porin